MRRVLELPLTLLLALVVRFPFWVEALRTPLDGDTAIIGLMARHPFRDTAMWGQPYGSPLEAWLALPVFALLGSTSEALRLVYFVLGLALVPLAYFLARELDPRAGLPAALLLACPPPYFLLLSSLPPPLYASSLLVGGLLLLLALRIGRRVADGEPPLLAIVLFGALAGVGLWTHFMLGSVVAACLGYVLWRARRRLVVLAAALLPLLAASAPAWWRALADDHGARVLALSGRAGTLTQHLGEVLPVLHRPLGGLLGTQTPLIADDAEHLVRAPAWVAAWLIVIYGLVLIHAVRRAGAQRSAWLLLAAASLALVAFPFPLRSGPAAIRFLTPLYLPVAVLMAWAPLPRAPTPRSIGARRALIVVLALACLNLVGGLRLLGAWRGADRAAAPFLLPDLAPIQQALEARGIRRAYASYGPAYRLTFESGERLIVSQPWNERFRHYRLPYLDEVRFGKNVGWVLTPQIPTDLPPPRDFEVALEAVGGTWRRTDVGGVAVFHDFEPPFGSAGVPWPGGGVLGDGDLESRLLPPVDRPATFSLPSAVPLDGLTLVAPHGPLRLLRSMDVLVSGDGVAFEAVARRRRRGERQDLRWVNGHPQPVLDHDLIAVALGGRLVKALRVVPVDSADPWALGEILLHPATEPRRRRPWDEWLDPGLGWTERRQALEQQPLRERGDWYYRTLLAARH